MRGNEKCAGANATEPTSSAAMVWSDEACTVQAPFMCRVEREWPALWSAHAPLSWCPNASHNLAGCSAARVAAASQGVACCRALCAAAAGYQYISPISGATFELDTRLANFWTAEAYCNSQGGHLAYYTSLEEQEDVETYYLAQVGRLMALARQRWHARSSVFACPSATPAQLP